MRPRSVTAVRPRDYLLVRRATRAAKQAPASVGGPYKLNYGLRIVLEARRPTSRVSPSLAFALIEQESGFRNVFGCDRGQGKAYCHQAVTAAKVRALIKARNWNGIGPAQLTWEGYVMEAQRDGGAHKTSVNIATGIRILDSHIKATGSEFKALATYNAGNPNSPQGQRYARQVLERKDRYHRAFT